MAGDLPPQHSISLLRHLLSLLHKLSIETLAANPSLHRPSNSTTIAGPPRGHILRQHKLSASKRRVSINRHEDEISSRGKALAVAHTGVLESFRIGGEEVECSPPLLHSPSWPRCCFRHRRRRPPTLLLRMALPRFLHQHRPLSFSSSPSSRSSSSSDNNSNILYLFFSSPPHRLRHPRLRLPLARRRHYLRLWWRPGAMRGYVWLNNLPKDASNPKASSSLPPIRLSSDISRFCYTNPTSHPSGLRIARILIETLSLPHPNTISTTPRLCRSTKSQPQWSTASMTVSQPSSSSSATGRGDAQEQPILHWYSMEVNSEQTSMIWGL